MKGDRCYVVHKGQVRGWLEITGTVHWRHGFKCSTTGAFWKPGNYIQRSGPWHPISDGRKIRGFQGIRRFQHADSSKLDEVKA